MPSRLASLGLAVVLVASITACTPTPQPTPTPTGFATEDEAFAAAEELYQSYVDEINAYNAGQADANPLRFLIGDIREAESSVYEQSKEAGLTWEGDLKVTSMERGQASLVGGAVSVHLMACMDASDWRLINVDGDDVTLDDVPVKYLTDVEVVSVNVDQLAILSMTPDFESKAC